jgi:ACR3 family arsenite efflux pump ArsB/nucleotide-binding universal stress UspA family protein
MLKLLTQLQKNLVWAIPIAMLCGLLFGYFTDASALKRFIVPVTFVMVYPMMVTLNVKSIYKGGDSRLQITTQTINFILIPVLAFFIGKMFFAGGLEKYGLWAVGLFLIGVLPTSGMTISWTGFAGGNKEAAIKMVLFGLVLGALAAPVYTKVFMGAAIDVDMLHMFRQIALFVFVPLIAGVLTQHLLQKRFGMDIWNRRIKPKFPPFSALGVVMIAFLAMGLKARHIIQNPGDLLVIFIPLVVFYLVSYLILSVAGRLFFRREDAVAMVFGVVMRDLSIALAIAMTAFGKQGATIALLIALAYVVQIQSAAWYVRFADKIFGAGVKHVDQSSKPPARGIQPGVVDLEPKIRMEPATTPSIQKILYATDLSQTARHAARYACSLGHRFGAEVFVVNVIQDVLEALSTEAGVSFADMIEHDDWASFQKEGIEKAKHALKRRIREASQDVKKEIPHCPLSEERVFIEVGDPVHEVLSVAEKGRFDLIVLGTHGHGNLERTVLGSVAGDIVKKSSIPVMVVRLPKAVTTRRPAEVLNNSLPPQTLTGL